MALKEYITLSDITYKPIKNAIAILQEQGGDLSEMNDYLERTNNYYEDLAEQVGIFEPEELRFPIPTLSKEHLNYYFAWKYASENDNQVPTEFLGESTYAQMEENAFKYYKDTLKDMNEKYLLGTADKRSERGASFGVMYRS